MHCPYNSGVSSLCRLRAGFLQQTFPVLPDARDDLSAASYDQFGANAATRMAMDRDCGGAGLRLVGRGNAGLRVQAKLEQNHMVSIVFQPPRGKRRADGRGCQQREFRR